MEKKLIDTIQTVLPQIMQLANQKSSLSYDYDKEADVLYITFDKNATESDTEMINDDILLRKKDNQIIGITILHVSKFEH